MPLLRVLPQQVVVKLQEVGGMGRVGWAGWVLAREAALMVDCNAFAMQSHTPFTYLGCGMKRVEGPA